MKTVSQEFQDILAKNDVKPRREVSMKRRYWDQVTAAYVWEADWTVIPESEVVTVSPVVGQLDTEIMNEFKVSNVTITFKNHDNRWRPDNPAGKFAQNVTLSLYPFEPYFTKFRVRSALLLASGSEEYVSLFTGLLTEMTSASDDQIQMSVQGLESFLQNANAENVSTRVVNEVLGTGNGVLVDFTTALPGVGIIEEVSVAGIAQDPGDTTWSVSQLNEVTLGAKITFVTAPASGTIRATYRYWKQIQTFEGLISDLLTEAGVPSANQIIDSVIFPGSVSSTWTQTTQGDWLAGTLTGMEATSCPGDVCVNWADQGSWSKVLLDDFSDGDFTNNPTWTIDIDIYHVPPNGTPSVISGVLCASSAGTLMKYSSSSKIGTWSSSIKCVTGIYQKLFLLSSGGFNWAASGTNYRSGYALYMYFNGVVSHVSLEKVTASGSSGTIGYANTSLTNGTYYNLSVSRSPSGKFSVKIDGTLLFECVDTEFENQFTGFGLENGGRVEDVYHPAAILTPSFISQTHDIGSTPTSMGKLLYDETLTGSTSTFSTRTSADGATWDAWVAISGTGQVMSTPRRYVQVKWAPSIPSNGNNDAVLHSFTLQYSTASATISLANFTGMTCYQAIQQLGKFTNYEWGFTADEDFFFRPKEAVPTQDIVLAHDKNVSEISGLQTGWDRVYSEVRATYGAFSKTLKAPGDTPLDPASRFKSRILEIDGGDIMLSADGNVAGGVASIFFAYFSKPRRRFKAKCKFLPQIDLSDVALVNFNNNLPRPVHLPGDESHYAGETGLRSWGPREQLVGKMLCKVIGARHDLEGWNSELDLEEIPS